MEHNETPNEAAGTTPEETREAEAGSEQSAAVADLECVESNQPAQATAVAAEPAHREPAVAGGSDPAAATADRESDTVSEAGVADNTSETTEAAAERAEAEPECEDGPDLAAALAEQPLERILEAMIGSTRGALGIDRMIKALGEQAPPKAEVREALARLAEDCACRSVELKETASGFRFQVRQDFAPWVARLTEEKPQRYSRAALETLALIAYRQPITRGEIEEVRGVAVSTNIIRTLEERNWVRVVGHKDVPGRPALFATTREFLDYFGMKTLTELPSLEAVKDLDAMGEKLAGLQAGDEPANSEQIDADAGETIASTEAGAETDSGDEFVPALFATVEDDLEPREMSVSSAVEAAMAMDIGMSLEPDQDDALDDGAEAESLFSMRNVFGSPDVDEDESAVEAVSKPQSEEPVEG